MFAIVGAIEPVFRDLFGGSLARGDLYFAAISPTGYDGSYRRIWSQLRRAVMGSWILPLDIYTYVSQKHSFPVMSCLAVSTCQNICDTDIAA